ncbi:PREDICTED: CMP-sialic acid transporter 1 [Nicrophorus vespilloides]|uniref:CMP-sialic acid transporter 1 n=1 Tax=Nicrophorus vespilloides TaxID=110193 RepID=A0ABM1MEH8_NICVS|nr:PREDICTED: CMP-sialic acid transporter 1 [Nicrophorus vespilloides]
MQTQRMSFIQSFSKLFPSKSSFIIFSLYIILFCNHGILVTASQTSSNRYEYNVATVVLLTETLKLLASVGLYCKDNEPKSLVKDVVKNKTVLALYLIPAFLYCLYNNLSFENLLRFDPTTYNLLLQFRIFFTAILFQVLFKKTLTGKQWLSLVILTLGCMLKQLDFNAESADSNAKMYGFNLFSWSTVLILVQMLCSCFAGVYNEYLLKNDGANVNIFVQNVFMYLDSIFCNILVLLFHGNLSTAFQYDNLAKIMNFKVIILMINNASVGIITSFFLKQLNSILKTFASALELVFTAILCYFLFHIPIALSTVMAICTVLFAVYLYTQNPVKGQEHDKESLEIEREELLMDEVLVKE